MIKKHKSKNIILIRHAHRDTSMGRELDNGLSDRGLRQREKLSNYLIRLFQDDAVTLISSPRKRCTETLEIIANSKSVVLSEKSWLEEMEPAVKTKGKTLTQNLTLAAKLNETSWLVVSTHGDVLDQILNEIFGLKISMRKAAACEIRLRANEFNIIRLTQRWR